jgi:putative pyruvate formate lyase activating enzyme
MFTTCQSTAYVPNYVQLYESGELDRRVEAALASLEQCRVCPWDGNVNRLQNQTKVCRVLTSAGW